MTSNHHALYTLGDTRATMAGTKGMTYTTRRNTARWSKSHKAGLSSDRSLQFDSSKAELLVIADQNAAVNTFPGFVHTARQTMRGGNA